MPLYRFGFQAMASANELQLWVDDEPRATGKEYAADRLASMCADYGFTHALVNLAGDVRASGPQEDGAPWRIGIVHPRKPGSVVAQVELRDGALATSGDYERFFEVDG